MANKDLVTVVLDTAKSLGYSSLKPEQETALVSFLVVRRCSFPCLLGTGNVCVTPLCRLP